MNGYQDSVGVLYWVLGRTVSGGSESDIKKGSHSHSCLVCLIASESSNMFIFSTAMILSFWTEMPGKSVQTQIRLLLEEQSDQGLHCLPFHLHRLDSLLYGRAT